jgi:hypothetical protein
MMRRDIMLKVSDGQQQIVDVRESMASQGGCDPPTIPDPAV